MGAGVGLDAGVSDLLDAPEPEGVRAGELAPLIKSGEVIPLASSQASGWAVEWRECSAESAAAVEAVGAFSAGL